MRQLARAIVDALKVNPLVLALVVVTIVYLIGTGLLLREVAKSIERKDAILATLAKQLAENCKLATPKDEDH